MKEQKLLGVLYISTTRQCNISCEYCHLPKDARDNYVENPNKLLHMAKKLKTTIAKANVVYQQIALHGAECTLIPAKQLAELCNILKTSCLSFGMQSNLVRFAEKEYFDDFFEALDDDVELQIGTSIDGPKVIHNKSRDNSHSIVLQAIRKLELRGYRISVLTTITKHTIEHIDEFVKWAKIARGRYVDVKFRLVEGKEFELNTAEMRKYIRAITDNNIQSMTAAGRDDDATVNGNACDLLEIDAKGDCYACNQVQEKQGAFSNIFEEDFGTILDKRAKYYLTDEYLLHEDCLKCEALEYCNGGCPVFRTESNKAVDCSLKKTYAKQERKKAKAPHRRLTPEQEERFSNISKNRWKEQDFVFNSVGEWKLDLREPIDKYNSVQVCGFCIGGCISCISCVSNPLKEVERVVEDVGDFIGDVSTTVWNEVLEPAYDATVDFTNDIIEYTMLDPVDFVLDDVLGISGALSMLYDVNEGTRWIMHGIGDGNWDAIKAGAMIAAAVVITIMTAGAGASIGAGLAQAAFAMGITSAQVLMTAYYIGVIISIASTIYSLYGIAVSVAQIGEIVKNGGIYNLTTHLQQMKDAMNLAFTNAFINGSMNLWRAGGVLYDAPKAGDLQFNVTGNLNTVRFLGMEDKNTNNWYSWTNDKYHDFSSKTFGNMAGDMFFSVKPIV